MGRCVNRDEVAGIIRGLKNEGKQIVFTNGCFDLIHVGHIRYLNEAKKMGDVLVIGLNSDSSVARIKPGRPVTPENDRAEVLSALCMVDYVTLFEEDTPHDLIRAIQPDILVKGSDWKKEDIVGNDIVREVRTIPFVHGQSTSGIIDRIQKIKS